MKQQLHESIGLCAECRFHTHVRSNRGKEYHLCGYAKEDPAFPKYPRLPVLKCSGYLSAKDAKEREKK
jgi:hypothetical protein